jgi:AraC-like DNA-binding protein
MMDAQQSAWPRSVGAPVESAIASACGYGVAPGPAGYRLADMRCAPERDGWRPEGVYGQSGVGVVVSGVFDYSSEGQARTVVPGALLFANREANFACRHLCADRNRRLVLFFSATMLEAIADDLSLEAAKFAAPSAPPSPLTPLVTALMLRIAEYEEEGFEAAAAIARAALQAADGRGVADGVPAADRRRIVDVVRYINTHFAEPCTLDTLASIAHMSRFHFARRFRAFAGETANQYVLNRRLSAAAAQLVATNRPVSEIAYAVGFNDLSYFYARFKSAFGAAPGGWRRV